MKSEHDGLTSDGCIKSNSNIAKNEQSENELSDLKKGKYVLLTTYSYMIFIYSCVVEEYQNTGDIYRVHDLEAERTPSEKRLEMAGSICD